MIPLEIVLECKFDQLSTAAQIKVRRAICFTWSLRLV